MSIPTIRVVRIATLAVGAIALALLLATLLVLLGLLQQLGAAPRALGELTNAPAAAARAVTSAAQSARDALDPTHPPRTPLEYDAELDELRKVDVGQPLVPHPERDLTLRAIEKRVGADGPETAQYATIADRLKTPRELRVLGVVISRNDETRQYILYKGQLFRVARALYKVNWVAYEARQIAIGRLRSSDATVTALAFTVD